MSHAAVDGKGGPQPDAINATGRRGIFVRLPGVRSGRYLLLPAAALAVVLAVQVFNVGRQAPVAPAAVDVSVPDPGQVAPPADGVPLGGVDTTDTDRRIAFWRGRLQTQGDAATSYQILGDLLAQRGRETGDLNDITASEDAYRSALKLAPTDAPSMAGLARTLSTLHEFPEATTQALDTIQVDPTALSAVGVLFDASLELGRIDDATDALNVLEKRAPGAAVQVRKARLDFLRGDSSGAIALSRESLDDSTNEGVGGEQLAFYQYALGEYEFLAGRLQDAGAAWDAAVSDLPGYPLALYGQARVAFSSADLPTAIARMRQAVAVVPRPDLLAYLGDLYAVSGDRANAEKQYQTVDFIAGLGTTAGQVYNREYALFLANHHRNTALAVQLTSTELQQRKDVYGYDAYAWALYSDGRASAALDPMRRALAMGTQDARLLYHAGMIELADGLADQGRAHLGAALQLGLGYDPLGQAAAKQALGR